MFQDLRYGVRILLKNKTFHLQICGIVAETMIEAVSFFEEANNDTA
jgi:hypothetical protein